MKTIIALVDFSDLTFKVVKQAHILAEAFQAEMVILHTLPNQSAALELLVDSPPDVAVTQYNQLLDLRDSLVKFGVRASVNLLPVSSREEVLAEAGKLKADLLVLGSNRHSAFYDLIMGSFTNDVLKAARCPVLVVPGNVGDEVTA